jgi:hypothetical protein
MDRALTPHITVTIGQQTRVYFVLLTTAPPTLDAAGTFTLQAGTLVDLARLAATRPRYEDVRAPARLILVEALQLAWYRARCVGHNHLLIPVDPLTVEPQAVQTCLWQGLEASGAQQLST